MKCKYKSFVSFAVYHFFAYLLFKIFSFLYQIWYSYFFYYFFFRLLVTCFEVVTCPDSKTGILFFISYKSQFSEKKLQKSLVGKDI